MFYLFTMHSSLLGAHAWRTAHLLTGGRQAFALSCHCERSSHASITWCSWRRRLLTQYLYWVFWARTCWKSVTWFWFHIRHVLKIAGAQGHNWWHAFASHLLDKISIVAISSNNWRAPEMNRTSGYIPFFRPSLNSDVFSVYYSLSKLGVRVLCMRKVDFSRTEQVFLFGKYTERIFILCSLLLSVHEVLDYVCPSILACWAKISGARTEQLIIFPGFLPR